jgi:hypothetical protein
MEKSARVKSVTNLLFLIACIFAFASFASAQESNPTLPPQPDFTIVVKHEYRKSEVMTLVSLERMFIKAPDATGDPIGLGSLFVYDEKSQVVTHAYISFYSLSQKCRLPYEPEVTFVVDGNSIRIGHDFETAKRGEGIATSFAEPEGGKCNESLDVIIPQKTYLRIANAERVEVQLGSVKLQLGEMHLKALQELARRMVAPKGQHNN